MIRIVVMGRCVCGLEVVGIACECVVVEVRYVAG